MSRWGLPAAGLAACLFLAACQQTGPKAPGVDYMERSPDFSRLAPADVAVLPVYASETMDGENRKLLRRDIYELMMEKGYAPLSCEYVDGLLAGKGLMKTRLAYRHGWNTEPFKGLFFSDGIVMVSVESFREPGAPSDEGIEIWGKAALFDGRTGELLYEHYIRRNQIISDPGSRKKYIARAIADFARDLLAYLPEKPGKPGRNGEESEGGERVR